MDLTAMSLQDLAALKRGLEKVSDAAGVLDRGGLAPVISLGPQGVVIRCAPLWGAAPDNQDARHGVFPDGGQDLSAIQPGLPGRAVPAAEAGVDAKTPAPAAAAAESGDRPAAGTQAPAVVPAAAVEAPRPGAGDSAGAGARAAVIPLSDAEKQEILRRHSAGQGAKDIAREMGRAVAQVTGWIGRCTPRQGKAGAIGAPVPAPVAAAPVAAPAVDLVVAPVSAPPALVSAPPALVSQAPAPERAPFSGRKPAAARRPVAPDHLSDPHRRIWAWLDGLDDDPDFDARADLAIYDACETGAGVTMLATDWGMDSKRLFKRYQSILRCICSPEGKPRPELRMKLSAVLRWRAEAVAEARVA